MSTDKTTLGDRIKSYEAASTSRCAVKGEPIIARLDGRAFHTFTQGLERPYDARLSALMSETLKALVENTGAKIGYQQSDEISLVWYVPADSTTQYPHGGRFQKLDSLLAAYASSYFNSRIPKLLPEKSGTLALFDARTFSVPDLQTAYECLLWRQRDSLKNSISMAAQSVCSHRELQGLNGLQMKTLMAERGLEYSRLPEFFKLGVFAQRTKVSRRLSVEELAKLPECARTDGLVVRPVTSLVHINLEHLADPIEQLFGLQL